MKIGKVTIKNFKSILSTAFDIEEGLLALAGGNETGKSNVLLAVHKFLKQVDFEDDDKCQLSNEDPSVEVEFKDFTSDQSKNLSEITDAKNVDKLIVKRTGATYEVLYPAIKYVSPELNPSSAPKQSQSPAPEQIAQPAVASQPVVAPSADATPDSKELNEVKAEEKIPEVPVNQVELEKDFVDKVTKKVLNCFPKSVLISSLGQLIECDRLSIAQLTPIYFERKSSKKNDERYEIMRRFLQLGDIKDEDLVLTHLTKRNSILNKKIGKISTLLTNSWTQEKVNIRVFSDDKELTIQFMDCTNVPDPNDPSTWVWTLPENRSQGFRWYITFYSMYLYGISRSKNAIFLIDDAGAFLNKRAQENLLSEFKKISDKREDVQVIYTTHSKYMVDWNFKSQIYCVTKGARTGTVVAPRWWEKFSGNQLPAPLSELGVTYAEDYLSHNSLIVEGYTDPIIILGLERIFSSQLHKNPFFGFSFLPGHGANEPSMTHMGHLCKILGHKEFLLFDSDNIGLRRKTDATNKGLAVADIASLGNTSRFNLISTEDLLPVTSYKEAVNFVGARQFPDKWDRIDTLQGYLSLGLVEAIKKRMREGMEIGPDLVRDFFLGFKEEIAKKAVSSANDGSYGKEQKESVIKFFNTLYQKLSAR